MIAQVHATIVPQTIDSATITYPISLLPGPITDPITDVPIIAKKVTKIKKAIYEPFNLLNPLLFFIRYKFCYQFPVLLVRYIQIINVDHFHYW